jgi:hypothetical protein
MIPAPTDWAGWSQILLNGTSSQDVALMLVLPFISGLYSTHGIYATAAIFLGISYYMGQMIFLGRMDGLFKWVLTVLFVLVMLLPVTVSVNDPNLWHPDSPIPTVSAGATPPTYQMPRGSYWAVIFLNNIDNILYKSINSTFTNEQSDAFGVPIAAYEALNMPMDSVMKDPDVLDSYHAYNNLCSGVIGKYPNVKMQAWIQLGLGGSGALGTKPFLGYTDFTHTQGGIFRAAANWFNDTYDVRGAFQALSSYYPNYQHTLALRNTPFHVVSQAYWESKLSANAPSTPTAHYDSPGQDNYTTGLESKQPTNDPNAFYAYNCGQMYSIVNQNFWNLRLAAVGHFCSENNKDPSECETQAQSGGFNYSGDLSDYSTSANQGSATSVPAEVESGLALEEANDATFRYLNLSGTQGEGAVQQFAIDAGGPLSDDGANAHCNDTQGMDDKGNCTSLSKPAWVVVQFMIGVGTWLKKIFQIPIVATMTIGMAALASALMIVLSPVALFIALFPGRWKFLGTYLNVLLFIKVTVFFMYLIFTIGGYVCFMLEMGVMRGAYQGASGYTMYADMARVCEAVMIAMMLGGAPKLAAMFVFQQARHDGLAEAAQGAKDAAADGLAASAAVATAAMKVGSAVVTGGGTAIAQAAGSAAVAAGRTAGGQVASGSQTGSGNVGGFGPDSAKNGAQSSKGGGGSPKTPKPPKPPKTRPVKKP